MHEVIVRCGSPVSSLSGIERWNDMPVTGHPEEGSPPGYLSSARERLTVCALQCRLPRCTRTACSTTTTCGCARHAPCCTAQTHWRANSPTSPAQVRPPQQVATVLLQHQVLYYSNHCRTIPNKYPLQTQQECASGTLFGGAKVCQAWACQASPPLPRSSQLRAFVHTTLWRGAALCTCRHGRAIAVNLRGRHLEMDRTILNCAMCWGTIVHL